MTDRKHYSKTREDRIWLAVDKAITDFRISTLRGALYNLNKNGQEQVVYEALNNLPDIACAEYRKLLREKP